MNRRQALTTLGASGLAQAAIPPCPAAEGGRDERPPAVSIQEAIRLAKAHVKEKRIEVKGKHIASATFHPEAERPHWEVTWKANKPVKGGWFAIHVRPDKSVEAYYGE